MGLPVKGHTVLKATATLLTLMSMLRGGLSETELKVSIIEAEGFCIKDTSIDTWVGFIPDVVNELGKRLKFTPKFEMVGDGRYGSFEESTGKWTGLIGEVVEKKVDFAAAPLTQTSLREQHIDFTHEILDVGLVIIVKVPERLHPVTRSASFFLSVFDAGAWIGVFLVLTLAWILIYLNARFNPREHQQGGNGVGLELHRGGDAFTGEFSLLGSLFFVVSTGCFQGFRQSPQSLAGRCLCTLWWLFVLVLVATYVAGVLCGLIASQGALDRRYPNMDPRERFASDPVAFDSFVPVWIPGGSTHSLIKNSDNPFLHHLWQLYLRNETEVAKAKSVQDVIKLVESDTKYIGVMESDLASLYARRSECKLAVASTLLTDRSYAFAFPENSTWIRRFNTEILRLREDGFIRASYVNHFGSSTGHCNFNSLPAETLATSLVGEEIARMFRNSLPITMGTLMGPIFMFCLGLLLALAAAAADVFIYTRLERYQGNQQFHSARNPPFGGPNFEDHDPDEPNM